jgi:hypothetical protein
MNLVTEFLVIIEGYFELGYYLTVDIGCPFNVVAVEVVKDSLDEYLDVH